MVKKMRQAAEALGLILQSLETMRRRFESGKASETDYSRLREIAAELVFIAEQGGESHDDKGN